MAKIVDKEEMRRGIMEAALSVYSRIGIHAATISDITAAAGLGKGTLYLYFKSKDELTLAIVERMFSGMETEFIPEELADTLDGFVSGLADMANAWQPEADSVRVFFEVFGPSFRSREFTATVAGFFDRLGDHFARQIDHLQKRGEIDARREPAAVGRALAAMLDGLIIHHGLFAVQADRYEAMVREMTALIAGGLRP